MTDEELRMKWQNVWVLTVGLSAVVLLSFCMVYSLWSAEPLTVTGPVPSPDCSQTKESKLTHVHPMRISAGGAQEFWLAGCGFSEKTEVKLNGALHQPQFIDASHIRVGLSAAEVAAPGAILATLSHAGKVFGSGSVLIVPAAVTWEPPWPWSSPRSLSQEVQALLLVFFVGMLCSTVYALKSMANYRGDRKLNESWFMFYCIQPLEGAGIAFLVYLVIRGGFLAGTGADIKSANLFGICAFAGLSGTFSDIAFRKLREVFETLFRPLENRKDRAGSAITNTALKPAVRGQAYSEKLSATGGTTPLSWAVSPALPDGLSLDAATGVISGTPRAVSKKTKYQFTVTDSSPSRLATTAELELEVQEASGAAAGGGTAAGGSAAAGGGAAAGGSGGVTAGTAAVDVDGCDVAITEATPDDELPTTQGGVA